MPRTDQNFSGEATSTKMDRMKFQMPEVEPLEDFLRRKGTIDLGLFLRPVMNGL